MTHPVPRRFGAVNWLGLWTLYEKEVWRFLKVYAQTILAPLITTHVFLVIFVVALGRAVEQVGGVPFTEFLAPGLVMMAMAQNAFANSTSTIMLAKIQGNIIDVLMPPLSPFELTFGYVAAGLTRGLVVGVTTGVVMFAIVGMAPSSPAIMIYFAIAATLLLSLIGTLTGLWAEKFDHTAAITNFVVTPLAFLSGTFYSIERLPPAFQWIAQFNPFFYMIDGFRFAFIGHSDAPVWIGMAVLFAANLVLWILCWYLFKVGYKIKA